MGLVTLKFKGICYSPETASENYPVIEQNGSALPFARYNEWEPDSENNTRLYLSQVYKKRRKQLQMVYV